jgi:hypothetical protein
MNQVIQFLEENTIQNNSLKYEVAYYAIVGIYNVCHKFKLNTENFDKYVDKYLEFINEQVKSFEECELKYFLIYISAFIRETQIDKKYNQLSARERFIVIDFINENKDCILNEFLQFALHVPIQTIYLIYYIGILFEISFIISFAILFGILFNILLGTQPETLLEILPEILSDILFVILFGKLFDILFYILFGIQPKTLFGILPQIIFDILFGILFNILLGTQPETLLEILPEILSDILFVILFGKLFYILFGIQPKTLFGILPQIIFGKLFSILFVILSLLGNIIETISIELV